MVCRVMGIVLGLGACILTLWCVGSYKWSVSVPQTASGQPISITASRGLWKQCMSSGNGDFNSQCNKYSVTISQLAKTGIVGQRALMVLATIFAFAGLMSGITSSDAVNIAATSGNKSKAAGGAAALFAVSGLCTLAACSWAAAKIVKNNDMGLWGYNNGMNIGGGKGMIMTLGSGLYAGWCGAALSLIIAVMFGTTCCGTDEEEEDDYQPGYQSSVAGSMPAKQFV